MTDDELAAIRAKLGYVVRVGIGASSNPDEALWRDTQSAVTLADVEALLGHIDALAQHAEALARALATIQREVKRVSVYDAGISDFVSAIYAIQAVLDAYRAALGQDRQGGEGA